jgi:cell division septum initiation protein DivIVA
MLQDLENNFSVLEKKVLNLHKNYKNLSEQFTELSLEYEQMKKKYEEERQKNIKLYSALSGNPDHNRLMKNHINRLVKEVDTCIAQLQNSGL